MTFGFLQLHRSGYAAHAVNIVACARGDRQGSRSVLNALGKQSHLVAAHIWTSLQACLQTSSHFLRSTAWAADIKHVVQGV